MGKFRISGVPITDDDRKLVGIITNRDLKFEEDFSRPIKECMTSENLVTAPVGITLEEAKKILGKARKEKLPIVDDEFKLRGLITIRILRSLLSILRLHMIHREDFLQVLQLVLQPMLWIEFRLLLMQVLTVL